MLQLKDVRKVYDGKARVVALDGVTLAIGAGEMVAVMGPSGSGKSTLLNLIGGLDVPTSGALLVAGEDLATKSEEERSLFRRTHVSYVFQAYHLMPTLSAAQNVELPLHLRGAAGRRERASAALKTLGEVGLAGAGDAPPGRALRRRAAAGRHRAGPRHRARRSSSPTSRPGTSTRRQGRGDPPAPEGRSTRSAGRRSSW